MIKKITHLLIVLVIFSPLYLSMLNTSVFAAACPVTDGGAGDGDSTVNGIITISSDATWTADGTNLGSFDCSGLEIKVTNNKTLTLASYDNGDSDWTNDHGVSITADNITIDSGATMSADGKGYAGGVTIGADGSGSGKGYGSAADTYGGGGAGYGGLGGNSTYYISGTSGKGGSIYDAFDAPVALGSGGASGIAAVWGTGGAGGGAISFTVTDTFNNAGAVTANGVQGTDCDGCAPGGGGSGGSIYVTAVNLAGTGNIYAKGGDGGHSGGHGGNGGGGRVAIKYTSTDSSTYSVSVSPGVTPEVSGTAGTSFIENTTTSDMIIPSANGIWYASDRTSWSFHDLNIKGSVTFQPVSQTLFTITSTGTTTIAGSLTLIFGSSYSTNDDGVGTFLNLAGDVTIPASTTLTVDSQGYAGGTTNGANGMGTGRGNGGPSDATSGGGAGHGGAGGDGDNNVGSGGSAYGSASAPVTIGSGGGAGNYSTYGVGGAGGGTIRIMTTGTLNILGTITANGASAPSFGGGAPGGGGSGGSVYLTANILEGSGSINVKGGDGGDSGQDGGNGGGGIVALHYMSSSTYAGAISVAAGTTVGQGGSSGISNTLGIPQNPSSMAQYKSNGTTLIATGASTNETTVVLKISMSHAQSATLTPKFEVRQVGTSFTDTATDTGGDVAYSGSPVTGTVTVTGLSDTTTYHWQAQVCDDSSYCSSWTSYPDTSPNAESATDFQIMLNQDPDVPISLGASSMVDGSFEEDNTPTLSFSLSDPDVGNTVQYQIQIDDTSNFSSPIVDYTSVLAAQGARTFTVGQAAGSGSYTTGQSGLTLSDGSYYWRVKTIDSSSVSSSWVTANSGSVAFIIDTATPTFSLSSPSNKYISDDRPTFKWKASTESTANLSKYKLEIDNGVSGSISIDGIAVSGTTAINTDKYIISYEGFGDSDNTNNYISVITKSSSSWGSGENYGKLIEGKRTWKVTLTDQAGNEKTESTTVFVDKSGPSVSHTYAGGVISGKATDSLNGDSATTKVASGVEKVSFLIERSLGSTYTFVYSADIYPAANYSESTGAVLTDSTSNTSGKYVTFSFSPSIDLYGTYRVTVSATDKAGNSSSRQETLSAAVVTVTPTLIPTLRLTPTLPVKVTPTIELTPTPTGLLTPTPTSAQVATRIVETISQTYEKTVEAVAAAVDNVKERVVRTMEVLGVSIQANILDKTTLDESVGQTVNQASEIVQEVRVVFQENPVASQGAAVASTTTQAAAATVVVGSAVSSIIAVVQTTSSVSHILEAVSVLESKGIATTMKIIGSQFFTGLLGGIFVSKKRRRSVGIAYDSSTNLPLSGALLVFFSQGGNLKLVTTNASGRFQVAAAEDEYEMRAEKVGYEFPSKMVLVPQNETYASIYLPGQKFHLGPLSQSNIAVPLDPKAVSQVPMNRVKIFLDNLLHLLLGQKNFLLPLVSLSMSGYAAFVFPTLVNKAVFLVIFLWQVWQIHRDMRKTAEWGCVFDRNNKPLKNYTVKLYLYNNHVKDFYALAQTDVKGRYLFTPENGAYVMEVCDPKMKPVKEGSVKVTDENPKVDLMIKLS